MSWQRVCQMPHRTCPMRHKECPLRHLACPLTLVPGHMPRRGGGGSDVPGPPFRLELRYDLGMEPVQPVLVADLFPGLHAELISLLRGLSPEDWRRPTVAGAWSVQDVTAHLLDVQLRRLSAQRDGARLPPPDPPLAGYDDLVALVNRLNAEWVAGARRFSPR